VAGTQLPSIQSGRAANQGVAKISARGIYSAKETVMHFKAQWDDLTEGGK
jgi:hypothetical protein